ncbi:MAG TPA: aldehyde dehydrogenase (NADP(+)) [Arachnia sp.]|nr:aldehyde dehydrogenase (NADP(+)) [Arachnia sp.]HMT86534.1 aldehyde dehydrogenase (NADP(+)) [Arachnia sp.]
MTDLTELDQIAQAAADAAAPFADTEPKVRAEALIAVADALEAHADELVPLGMQETGLTEVRLRGELKRTAVQLRLFADVIVDGAYLDVRIDEADPGFALGVRPDLRRYHVALGPVLNFAASNFPFAFSVAGGDSAAALAAGCPVILKAHSGHPELSKATARVVAEALASAGMPEGVFQLVAGQAAGTALLKDPRIKAGSFTGSLYAGRLLADIAAGRPDPIPFFGELGSVNPVIVTAAAVRERGGAIASGYVTSVAGSAGQLCTKPGFVFVPVGHGLGDAIVEAAASWDEHRMLNPRIAQSFAERRAVVAGATGVRAIVDGSIRFDDEGQGWARPSIYAASLSDVEKAGETVFEESFGPLSVLVEYGPDDDVLAALAEHFGGNLTVTLHLGVDEAGDGVRALVREATLRAGRVLFGGWPTGVAVTPAMQHGGPWPATTNDASTSVGTAAISRFLRPVAYQDAPQELLPIPLRDDNPWRVAQRRSPAGESVNWGAKA